MGKRKFNKPDDSESEYEWEESQPNPPKIKNAIIDSDIDLCGFLNKYTSKSSKDVLIDKKKAEREKEEKLIKSRMCVTEEVSSHTLDSSWLRRVYNRIREQALKSGGDFAAMLRERYDEKTVRMMEELCENRRPLKEGRRDDSKRKYESYSNHMKRKYSNRNNRDRNSMNNNSEFENMSRNSHLKESGKHSDQYSDQKSRKNSYHRNDSPKDLRNNDTDYKSHSKLSNETHRNVDETKDVEERYVTMVDLNEAAASLFKVELSGNIQKIAKLQKRLDILREAQTRNLKVRLIKQKKEISEDRSVMIEKSLKSGRMIPYMETGNKFVAQSSYFESMKREEDARNADEDDWEFASVAGKISSKKSRYEETGEREYACSSDIKSSTKEKQVAISAQKRRMAQVNNCKCCYKNMYKHLVLSKGEYFYLIVPMDLGITDYHLQLLPIDHISASTRLDEDSWLELIKFKKQIVDFFNKELKSECIFMETVTSFSSHPHMIIDCIPMSADRDTFVSNKVYFKKAIEEAKSEWCQNKKIIDINKGDVRKHIPKEFPYFAVDFGFDGGLAFVIDDERKFSNLFGLEIIGSLLDKSLFEIKNRKEKDFNQQADTVLKAEKKWKNYDLWKTLESDCSDSD